MKNDGERKQNENRSPYNLVRGSAIAPGGPVLAAFCLLLAACAARETVTRGGTAVGTVAVVGNVPFDRLALIVDGRTTYLLLCRPELDDTLRNLQGKVVRVRFSTSRKIPDGIALDVVQAEPLKGLEHR